MKGFILFIISSFMKNTLAPFLYTYGCIRSLMKKEFNKYHFDLAVSKDQYGNVIGKYLFNSIMIKKGGHSAGLPDETISSVIGKNKATNTLTFLGKGIAWILNLIEPNHVELAIEKDEL